MTTLHVRVHKYVGSEDGPPPEVFGTIYPIDPESGRRVRGETPRRALIPISHRMDVRSSIPVSPGHYVVEVALPSGELLSGQANVAGADVEMVLQAEESPHEWLGWQHLVGNVSNVSSSAPASEQAAHGALQDESTRRVRGRVTRGRSRGAASPGASAPAPPDERVRLQSGELQWLAKPTQELVSTSAGAVWSVLAATSGDPVAALTGSGRGQAITAAEGDGRSAVYRLVRGPAGRTGATPIQGAHHREFAVLPRERVAELLALPMPWPIVGSGQEAVVEVVVRLVSRASEFASSIAVRDDRIGMLLGFLSSGALDAGREMAEASRDLLFGKTFNPLAAAAGAYTLAGTAIDTGDHEWHGWIRNLAEWFQQMPDGAIQLGWLLLRMRRSPHELDEARHWLKEGFRRGLPYYALGIRWLLDGLERIAPVDPEAAEMLKSVQQVGRRLHPHSPFTILRLGDEGDVRD